MFSVGRERVNWEQVGSNNEKSILASFEKPNVEPQVESTIVMVTDIVQTSLFKVGDGLSHNWPKGVGIHFFFL